MRYRIRFRTSAKEELLRAKKYSMQFSQELDEWLEDIAASSHRRDALKSIDLLDLLEQGINIAENLSPWKSVWKKWWKAAPIEKVKALITVLKKRCPPWQLRATSKWFSGILGAFDCEVHAYFEVNHVDGEVIFTKFAGLPGEDN
jgi:hypothetical protein